MKQLNVLYAIKVVVRDERILKGLKDKLIAGMELSGEVKVNKLDFVFSRQEIEEKIALKEYDLLVSVDAFEKDNISCGSIKIWRSTDPQIKIILTPPKSKKGSIKMIKLFIDVAYMDALYEEDVTGEEITRLFLNSRSQDEVVQYYGIEKCDEVIKMRKAKKRSENQEAVAEETPVEEMPEEDAPVGETDASTESVDAGDDKEISDTEKMIEHYSEQFSILNEKTAEDAAKEAIVVNQEEQVVEESQEDAFGFFGGAPKKEGKPAMSVELKEIPDYEKDDVAGTTFENPELAKATLVNTMNTQSSVDSETVEHMKRMADMFDEETSEIITGVPALIRGRVGKENILPTTGRLLRVITKHTFIFEFSEKPVLADGESLEDYKFVLLVQGKVRGHISNGRYHSGNLTFDAYVSCMVGKVTVMMDTLDFDCVANKNLLSGADCNILMVKL